jgi:hypothetical protein
MPFWRIAGNRHDPASSREGPGREGDVGSDLRLTADGQSHRHDDSRGSNPARRNAGNRVSRRGQNYTRAFRGVEQPPSVFAVLVVPARADRNGRPQAEGLWPRTECRESAYPKNWSGGIGDHESEYSGFISGK